MSGETKGPFMMRRKLLLAAALLLIALLPALALAKSSKEVELSALAVSPSTVYEASDPACVRWEKVDRKIYMFLPSGFDSTSLRIWFDGPETVTIDDKKVKPGDLVSCFVPGEKVTIEAGKKEYKVYVMQSAAVASIHIATESGSVSKIHASKENTESGQVVIVDTDGQEVVRQAIT